ncbi:hypothetical protein CEXT_63481 [Caerostris extrusa]|uniref:Uncharacterized protein n=1 Tax=Caerostris extrusa TaxID=172846 RepID=A0AAV4YA29_CAEEX|nr:hypothetical protein CEXT_63481 [Caerostris extrusa]
MKHFDVSAIHRALAGALRVSGGERAEPEPATCLAWLGLLRFSMHHFFRLFGGICNYALYFSSTVLWQHNALKLTVTFAGFIASTLSYTQCRFLASIQRLVCVYSAVIMDFMAFPFFLPSSIISASVKLPY